MNISVHKNSAIQLYVGMIVKANFRQWKVVRIHPALHDEWYYVRLESYYGEGH